MKVSDLLEVTALGKLKAMKGHEAFAQLRAKAEKDTALDAKSSIPYEADEHEVDARHAFYQLFDPKGAKDDGQLWLSKHGHYGTRDAAEYVARIRTGYPWAKLQPKLEKFAAQFGLVAEFDDREGGTTYVRFVKK